MKLYPLSAQQQAVADWVARGQGSLNLIARAGCGKTYTLIVGAVKVVIECNLGEVALMAFNKNISVEIEGKIQELAETDQRFGDWRRLQVGTCHSFGFRAWLKIAPRVRVDAKKVLKLIDARAAKVARGEPCLWEACATALVKAVSLAKQSACGLLWSPQDRGRWYDLLEHHAIDDDLADGWTLDDLIDGATALLLESRALDREVVDFDDMILAPLVHKARFWQKDWVLIDEAQDTNAARRALAFAMLKPRTGRLIAVGDDRQAIYGFTGADSDALDLIKRELGSSELPLTVTYRCPKAVVAEANRLVPDLEAHESAPAGIVRSLPLATCDTGQFVPWFVAEPPAPSSVVLCRNVKPLIEQAYALLRRGVGCRVEGRAIGDGLVKLATRWARIKTLPALADKLEDWQAKQVARWQAKGREERAQQVEDQCQCLQELIKGLQADGQTTIAALVAFLEDLFSDSNGDWPTNLLTLSTIHKAKGREWPVVYLLQRSETLPSRWARKSWQLRQEENLEYVALTRAQQELVYLG